MHPFINIGLRSLKAASNTLLRQVEQFAPEEEKNVQNTLKKTIKKANQKFIDSIDDSYPEHTIYTSTKDLTKSNAKYFWHFSALDGVHEYISDGNDFCASVFISKSNIAEHAIVFNPKTFDFFTATKGSGAKFNSNQRLRVNNTNSLTHAVISLNFNGCNTDKINSYLNTSKYLLEREAMLRQNGSTSLTLCNLAAGKLDAVVLYDVNLSEHTAALLIAKEAGAMVTDTNGNSININKTKDIVLANPTLHREIVKLTKEKVTA